MPSLVHHNHLDIHSFKIHHWSPCIDSISILATSKSSIVSLHVQNFVVDPLFIKGIMSLLLQQKIACKFIKTWKLILSYDSLNKTF